MAAELGSRTESPVDNRGVMGGFMPAKAKFIAVSIPHSPLWEKQIIGRRRCRLGAHTNQ